MRGYSGPRFGVQYSKDGNDPSMFITEPYYNYLHSLSPLQQISQSEQVAEDVNYRYRLLYLSRHGHEPTDVREWGIEDVLTRRPGAPYNTRTHTQYYYN